MVQRDILPADVDWVKILCVATDLLKLKLGLNICRARKRVRAKINCWGPLLVDKQGRLCLLGVETKNLLAGARE